MMMPRTTRHPAPPGTTGRLCALVVTGLLMLAGPTLSGCAMGGSHAADNRHPDMRHGNFEDPGSRAADNQGQAGRN